MALFEIATAMTLTNTVQAAAPPPTSAAKTVTPPSAELLEFLAEWSDDDAKLLDGETIADAARVRPAAGSKPAASKPASPKPKGDQ